MRVQAHVYRGYWEDVGTIRSYFDANLALCQAMPPFDFYDAARPVYTHPRFLPATKIEGCAVRRSLISEGCIMVGAEMERVVVGIRSRIGRGTQVRDSLVLGADFYETVEEIEQAHGARPAPRRASAPTRSSSTRSSTRTRASGAACGSSTRRACARRTARATTSATAS